MATLRKLLLVFLWIYTMQRLNVAGLRVDQPMSVEVESTGEATLECTHNCNENTELKLTILKGSNEEVICIGRTNSSVHRVNSTEVLHCQINRKPGRVSVTLYGFNSSLIDNYFCKIEKLYPPPYEGKKGSGTIIFTSKKNCQKCESSFQFVMLLTMGLLSILTVLSVIYSTVLTLKTCRAKRVTKKEEDNSVYEQMAPSTGGEQSRRNTESATTLMRKY
ncbi:T-cell-specific surface glycoprotein CD28 homolog [Stegostoma tigrinum]|uniref:T-cell-specific surface glycoprotein CD28 homolog n=1 Tax=Stegostoma tigrinum TaxID=3053191 RepID=UPI00202ACE5B|nr:T-cell-specific surface glycoprotein CD28 homolog [Stegostoma tigrinum]